MTNLDKCLNCVYNCLLLSRLVRGDVIEVDCLSSDHLFVVIYCSVLVYEVYVEQQLLWCFKLLSFSFFISSANPSHLLLLDSIMTSTWWAVKDFEANFFFSIWACLQNALESTLNTSCQSCGVHFCIYQYVVSYLNQNWM